MGTAEEEFWASIAQEKKEIGEREKKRQEAFMPKSQPTPIPEEGAETTTGEEEVSQNSHHI